MSIVIELTYFGKYALATPECFIYLPKDRWFPLDVDSPWLPPEGQQALITVYRPETKSRCIAFGYWQKDYSEDPSNPGVQWISANEWLHLYPGFDEVIAWMPLLDPYEGVGGKYK